MISFTKMHGAGNDFVVLDLRDKKNAPSADLCKAISNRHTGVGCDMILGIKAPCLNSSLASFEIWTPKGAPSAQCGNGARCVAAWLVRAGIARSKRFYIDSPSGPLAVEVINETSFQITMGVPRFSAESIPLTALRKRGNNYEVDLQSIGTIRFAAVSMGNPHAVIESFDIDIAPVKEIGQALREGPWLPPTINVGFAQVVSRQRIQLRVHEYGAGETLACGSGACAAAAALIRDGRIDRKVCVALLGGELEIHWPDDDGPITMAGPAVFVYEGHYYYAAI